MNLLTRRATGLAALALFAFSAAACGDNEPERRKAFVDFLQTQILDKPGVHVLKLNDADIKSFGDYAKHYAVITDFVADAGLLAMNKKLNDSLPELRSIQSLVDQRVAIRKAGVEMGEVLQAMNEKYDKTTAARGTLKQPDDLKAVYGKAFDRVVTAPVQGFRETTPIAQNIALAAANLGDYVAAHGDGVKVVGTSFQARDRKTQAEVDALVNALNANAPKFNEAQRRLRIVLQGN